MPENIGQAPLAAGERLAARSYCLQAGQQVSVGAYPGIETALCVLEGTLSVIDWETQVTLRQGELMIVPAGAPFGMENTASAPCLILQISTPRPWSADFQGLEPADDLMT